MPDPYHLDRFLQAQKPVYATVLAELTAGEKRTHWMWFIFPQIAGLGSSPTAQRYAISGLPEATAYLAHPVLGHRLVECTTAVHALSSRTPASVFGYPDDLKFRSSLTLFAQATRTAQPIFQAALDKYFQGQPDAATMARLPRNR